MGNQEAYDLMQLTVPQVSGSDEPTTEELLHTLGNLPLAITQAAAYISENAIKISEYLEAFRSNDSQFQELLILDLGDSRRDSEKNSSIIKTWKLSLDQISRQNPRAAEILSLISILDRQGIPKTLLRKPRESTVAFTTAIGTLEAFSRIGIEKGGATVEIHPLVPLSTQKWLELQGSKTMWKEIALTVLAEQFPEPRYEMWNQCEVLYPHARLILQCIPLAQQQRAGSWRARPGPR